MRDLGVSTWTAIVSALIAGVSLYISLGARKLAKEAGSIELDRRHTELEPKFKMEFRGGSNHQSPGVTQFYRMKLELIGPTALQELDKISIEIRDSKRKPPELQNFKNRSVMEKQLWSPYRFTPGVDEAPSDGRTVVYRPFSVHESAEFQLEDNPVPPGTSPDWWESSISSSEFKVWVICEKKDFRNWKIPLQLNP